MIVKIQIPRSFSPIPRRGSTALAAGALATGGSFHAVLTDCADDWVMRGTPRAKFTRRPEAIETERPGFGKLARAWSWLHKRYALIATKRLKVAETVSLGEKRFIALVSVEGREFLIGGGTAGVSLLAQLGAGSQSTNDVISKHLAGDSE